MGPRLSAQDSSQVAVADAVLIGKRLTSNASVRGSRSDGDNGSFGQTRVWVRLSDQACPSPLLIHVVDVLLGCADEEMVRSDTGRVITVVADVKPLRDLPDVHEPRDAVSRPSTISRANRSVPAAASSAGPNPAWPKLGADRRAVLVDLRPKAILKGLGALAPAHPAAIPKSALRPEVGTARLTLAARSPLGDVSASDRAVTVLASASLREDTKARQACMLVGHRDLPLTRNRGACPGPLARVRGTLRCNFTTLDQTYVAVAVGT